MNYESFKQLPIEIKQMCQLFDCMIVGSTVDGTKSDVDMIVPYNKWQQAASFLSRLYIVSLNKFGGYRFKVQGTMVDIWPFSLEETFAGCQFSNVYIPKSRILLTASIG